jgi:hypothetical protein
MNFDNWYKSVYNNIKLKTKTDVLLWHFGPTGVVLPSNKEPIGACEPADDSSERRNVIPEIIALDCEPINNLNNIVATLQLNDPPIPGGERPYLIYTTSDKNNIAVDELIKIKKSTGNKTPIYSWYYFVHAFIALDWYREYEFYNEQDLLNNKSFVHNYITMNRITEGPRNYRLILMSELEERNITDGALVSYTRWNNDNYPIPAKYIQKIKHYCSETKRFDVIGDNIDNQSMHINLDAHLSTFFNLTTETCFYEDFNHLTEKIFRPIVMLQPFVLASTPNSLEYLKSYGFKTFDHWIDESYDKIKNPFKRIEAIADVMQYISSLTKEQQQTMFNEMLPTLLHNRRHFYKNLYGIVYKEMWDNFNNIIADTNP